MKVFLAGSSCFSSYKSIRPDLLKSDYILESYYYIKEWQLPMIKSCRMFLLDSGAFTFMMTHKGKVDFDEYLTGYIDFINKYDVKYFFELDVDSVVGYERVKQLRARLERETKKQCIPVWHRSRGKEDYLQMVKDYKYVAIGGIASREITKKDHRFFKWFIDTAHKNGAKIHGLGFTHVLTLPKYNFDSIDSTTWLGARFGKVYRFTGSSIKTYFKKEIIGNAQHDSFRVEIAKTHQHNLLEWIKFQQYADVYL